jgi:hypothetical protein
VRDAEATAGKTSPAARKLRREDSRFTRPTSLFYKMISEYRCRKSIVAVGGGICQAENRVSASTRGELISIPGTQSPVSELPMLWSLVAIPEVGQAVLACLDPVRAGAGQR